MPTIYPDLPQKLFASKELISLLNNLVETLGIGNYFQSKRNN